MSVGLVPPGGLSSGPTSFDYFMVVGTLDDCISAMETLYEMGW
jgi:hypothetical protein